MKVSLLHIPIEANDKARERHKLNKVKTEVYFFNFLNLFAQSQRADKVVEPSKLT